MSDYKINPTFSNLVNATSTPNTETKISIHNPRNSMQSQRMTPEKEVAYPIHGPENVVGNHIVGADKRHKLYYFDKRTHQVHIHRFNRERVREQNGEVKPYLPAIVGIDSDLPAICIDNIVFGVKQNQIWATTLYLPNCLMLKSKEVQVVAQLEKNIVRLIGNGNLIYVVLEDHTIWRQLPWKIEQTILDFEEISFPDGKIPTRLDASGNCLYAIVNGDGAKNDTFFWLLNNTREEVFWREIRLAFKVSQIVPLHGDNGYVPHIGLVDKRRSGQQFFMYFHDRAEFKNLGFVSESEVRYTATGRGIYAQNDESTFKLILSEDEKPTWMDVGQKSKKGVMLFGSPNGHFPLTVDEDDNITIVEQ